MDTDVLIIGAGASGIASAIAAARAGARATVLEAQERPGRKLLVTGNGRCNLTNRNKSLPAMYHGSCAPLAAEITEKTGAKQLCGFFRELGLLTRERNGYVYPYSEQAASVLEILLAELRRLHVRVKLSERVRRIDPSGPYHFSAATDTWRYEAGSVILACGSPAAPSCGACEDGYHLARSLGISVSDPHPALVPVCCRAPFLEQTAGTRCHAAVSLLCLRGGKETVLATEEGEVQWTKYGLSGIVIFQLSGLAAIRSRTDRLFLSLDFLPELSRQETERFLAGKAADFSGEPAAVLLRGLLPERLIAPVLQTALSGKAAGFAQKTGSRKMPGGEQLRSLAAVLKDFRLPVTGTKSFDQAQVCSGGVPAEELKETLELRRCPGVYITGELADVDGPCGGYNLHWAFASGLTAGAAAAKAVRAFSETENRRRP